LNYYDNMEHILNNTSESFNNLLNNLFPKKKKKKKNIYIYIYTFYKLMYILKKEESLTYNDYDRRIDFLIKNNRYLEKELI